MPSRRAGHLLRHDLRAAGLVGCVPPGGRQARASCSTPPTLRPARGGDRAVDGVSGSAGMTVAPRRDRWWRCGARWRAPRPGLECELLTAAEAKGRYPSSATTTSSGDLLFGDGRANPADSHPGARQRCGAGSPHPSCKCASPGRPGQRGLGATRPGRAHRPRGHRGRDRRQLRRSMGQRRRRDGRRQRPLHRLSTSTSSPIRLRASIATADPARPGRLTHVMRG